MLYRKYHDHFGKNSDDMLVIQAPTRTLNPTIKQSVIDAALLEDPIHGDAEWNANFRDEISGYLTREDIDAAVDCDIVVRPPQPNIQYFSFTDGSGGRHDSFCCGITHLEGNIVILDCLIEIANVVCGALVLASSLKLDVVPLCAPIICYAHEATMKHWSNI